MVAPARRRRRGRRPGRSRAARAAARRSAAPARPARRRQLPGRSGVRAARGRRPTRRPASSAGSTSWRSAGRRRSSPRRCVVACSGAASPSACRRWPASSRRGMPPGVERQMGAQALAALDRLVARAVGSSPRRGGRRSPHASQALAAPRRRRATCSSSARARRSVPMRSRCRAAPWCCSTSWSPRPSTTTRSPRCSRTRSATCTGAHDAPGAADVGGRRARRGRRRRRAVAVVLRGGPAGVPARRALLARLRARGRRASGSPLLDRAGIDRGHFVRFLTRMEQEHPSGLPGFLSTHPRAEERGRDAGR